MHCSISPLCIQSNMSPPLTEHTDIGCMVMSLACAQPAHITAKRSWGGQQLLRMSAAKGLCPGKCALDIAFCRKGELRGCVPSVPLSATLIGAGPAPHTSLAQTGLLTADVTASLKHVGPLNTATLRREAAR